MVLVDPNPAQDAGWAALRPVAPTDRLHSLDAVPNSDAPTGASALADAVSEAVKRVKPHVVGRCRLNR
jgi:hypothetical protein